MAPLTQTFRDRLLVIGLFLALLLLLVSACGTQSATPMEAATPSPPTTPVAPEPTSAPASAGDGSNADKIAAAVASRTPVPTPTPSPFNQRIDEFAEAAGLTGKTFLGLTIDNWINIGVSVLIVIIGYFVATQLLAELPKWINQHTSLNLSEDVLKDIGENIKRLVLLFFIRFAVMRLEFLGDGLRTFLDDAFFVLGLVIVTMIALKLVNSTVQQYKDSLDPKVDRERLTPIVLMAQRLGDLMVLIITGSFGLSHFGVNINVLSAGLIVFGLILYFGAQDIITDMISGFIILVDQPYRVGDAILVKELDTWGEVLDIGARTTHIHTGDNREVIVPNSQILQSKVVNYTYPDPRYRTQTDIGVAYGTDVDKVRQVIVEAVRGVDGVLPDKNVDVRYLEFGDSARKVRVLWWIGDFHEEQTILDKVNIALETALDKAGIDLPFNTYDLNINMQSRTADPDGRASEGNS
jgi:small-conductance mechanosensitive channel